MSGSLSLTRCVRSFSDGKAKRTAATETLIFVDVDGVLNVAVADPGHSGIEFTTANLKRAEAKFAKWNSSGSLHPTKRLTVDRVMATNERMLGHGENATYKKLIAHHDTKLSDVLVGRLAQIIRAAGSNVQVVLSSTWRWPKNEDRVSKLEEAIGRHLGEDFEFDARTALRHDGTAERRLKCITEFAAAYCETHHVSSSGAKLRMIVLDNFNMSAHGTWACDGNDMQSAENVEQYLLSWIPDNVQATAKLVHTYCEWTEPDGLEVQVGCGLTKDKLCQALTFLGMPCKLCSQPTPGRPQLPQLWHRETEARGHPVPELNHAPGCGTGTAKGPARSGARMMSGCAMQPASARAGRKVAAPNKQRVLPMVAAT